MAQLFTKTAAARTGLCFIRSGLALLCMLGAGAPALAGKVGPEFHVNTITSNAQLSPSVSSLANGGFVVAWQVFGTTSATAAPLSIQGQRFTGAGNRVGGQFSIASGPKKPFDPAVVGLNRGGFVVVWQWQPPVERLATVNAQLFSNAGSKVGTPFRISAITELGLEVHPSAAALRSGGFVVVWLVIREDRRDIFGQRLTAAGAKVGDAFQIDTTGGYPNWPSVAVLSNGDFVVVWNRGGVYGQRFSATGVRLGTRFRLGADGYGPSVASLKQGGFIATWESYGADGSARRRLR
jgi:hypothetical protein